MHVTSVLWAFHFAAVLEPEFAEPVRNVLRIIGQEMNRSYLGSQKMSRFREGFNSGPDEPYVKLDIGDVMVICKPPHWEVAKFSTESYPMRSYAQFCMTTHYQVTYANVCVYARH